MAHRTLTLALGLAAMILAPSAAQAQISNSIEDAPGYRTVPESEPEVGGGTDNGGTFNDGRLVIQAPGSSGANSGITTIQPSITEPFVQRVPTATFDPRQLAAFAKAAVKVQTLAEIWRPVIQDAITAEEAVTLTQEANAEKIRAIEETAGITPAAYAKINDAARIDPELRGEIDGLYQAAVAQAATGG